jgi:branched-subunit amino acid aminotransferase/4-amino-4-deoxychorismate lyase
MSGVRAGTRLRWVDPERGFGPGEEPTTLLAMDSWLVDEGRVKALDAHAERFISACAALRAIPARRTAAFLGAAAERLPRQGRWFPRVELVLAGGALCFQLWVRPAPPRGERVRLWTPPHPDRRIRPSVKGADLAHLTLLRQQALDAGADEALILAPDGRIREGSTTSLLWWRGDTLCAVPEGPDALASVTRALLLRAASDAGVDVALERPTPYELDGLEVWAVNALHGIRPVTAWTGLPAGVEPGASRRVEEWNRVLDETAAPVVADAVRGITP